MGFRVRESVRKFKKKSLTRERRVPLPEECRAHRNGTRRASRTPPGQSAEGLSRRSAAVPAAFRPIPPSAAGRSLGAGHVRRRETNLLPFPVFQEQHPLSIEALFLQVRLDLPLELRVFSGLEHTVGAENRVDLIPGHVAVADDKIIDRRA